ncbi:MAG: erythromycin esterase family protein, partial [Bacteroidota bacterium]
MKSFSLVFILILISGCSKKHHAVEQEKLDALSASLHPVASIDPNDTSFADLDFLRSILSGNQIVLLGEQSHGDGAAFLAKARLIKFLHQKMGYDVLAMESGLFDCGFAGGEISKGIGADEAFRHSVFDLWTGSRQFQPVIEYLQQTQRTDRPMILSGFDMQITGAYGRDSLGKKLREYVSNIPHDSSAGSFALRMIDTLARSPKRFKNIPDSLRELFFSSLQSLRQDIEHSSSSGKQWWLQVIRSTETLARFLWRIDWNKPDPAVFNLRDRQMAENLLWLSRVMYPEKKIIVWAASSHISRNRQEIVKRRNADSAMIPMGDHMWRAMGDSIYAVGFTAYQGKPGMRGRQAWTLAEPLPGSIEDIVHHSHFNYAWLDFRSLPNRHWLRDTVRARP